MVRKMAREMKSLENKMVQAKATRSFEETPCVGISVQMPRPSDRRQAMIAREKHGRRRELLSLEVPLKDEERRRSEPLGMSRSDVIKDIKDVDVRSSH